MEILTLDEAQKTFQHLFQSASRTMFKAEVLQDYTAIDNSPSLRAWIAGDKEQSRTLGRTNPSTVAWRKRCLASPARITRVHVVEQPYTPYLAWEIEVAYKGSLLAHKAEDVRLAPQDEVTDELAAMGLQLPEGDFWMFDDRQVLQWEYENGVSVTVGARYWDETRGDNIDAFRQVRNTLLRVAGPVT